ncbi:hypothetical protein GDO81_021774 [Engystomops pustulosus]|uniref:Uncharacterized protein n=1 Tax=Engystomops pustulosus TaxID=76066 RepID=A0AAV6YNU3_ENGPU|nr:hypothetical protein GDO81_021774 [Engystomops pustulosus]
MSCGHHPLAGDQAAPTYMGPLIAQADLPGPFSIQSVCAPDYPAGDQRRAARTPRGGGGGIYECGCLNGCGCVVG